MPTDLLTDALWNLAWKTYDAEVLTAVAEALHLPEHTVEWKTKVVNVRGKPSQVSCLHVRTDVPLDVETVRRLIDVWFRLDPERGYWRCQTPRGPVVRDTMSGGAWWWNRETEDFVDHEGLLEEFDEPWAATLDSLLAASTEIEVK